MVGSLILSKIIEFKRNKKNNRVYRTKSNLHANENRRKPHFPSKTCRICLNLGTVPIFGSDHREDISEEVNLFGGIQVRIDDELPKYLCLFCNSLLQNAVMLRNTAQNTQKILNQYKIKNNLESYKITDYGFCSNDEELDCDNINRKIMLEPIKVYSEQVTVRGYSSECVYDKKKDCDDNKDNREISFERLKVNSEIDPIQIKKYIKDQRNTERRTCPICCRSCSIPFFDVHMSQHSKEKNPYLCDVCGKSFDKTYLFNFHHSAHFTDLPFKCPKCPYRGRFKGYLRSHMKMHSLEMSYQCKQCSMTFRRKSNLVKHRLTHTTERNFKCETCCKGFYSKKQVDVHIKVDHFGIKEHICNVCGRAFGYKKKLRKHELGVHKREKLPRGMTPLYLRSEYKQLSL